MKGKTKKIALCAILISVIVVLLYFASIMPVMSLSLVAAAGLVPAVAIIECNLSSGIMVYTASALLVLLLVPDKQSAIIYAVLFGNYPSIKYLTERVKRRWLTWGLKLVSANGLMIVVYLVFKKAFFTFVPQEIALWIAFAVFNLIFVMYDLCFSKLVAFYMFRIHRRAQ